MKATNYKVVYEKSNYVSVFFVEALNVFYEDAIYEELRKVCYGDGRFYLRKFGDKIHRIEFETDDEYYVEADFAKKHAGEISAILAKVARQHGTASALRA